MVLRRTGLRAICCLILLGGSACSPRPAIIRAGSLPPPDGAQIARGLNERLNADRRAAQLPPLPRDAALDDLAAAGLKIIEAGFPADAGPLAHLEKTAPLPADLLYSVGFEDMAPGVDERMRENAHRGHVVAIDEVLLAGDPALHGVGWAAGGPWSLFVFRMRTLSPLDGPALTAALDGGVKRRRPDLQVDARLASIAADVTADGTFDPADFPKYGKAGGVPVQVREVKGGPHLATMTLSSNLAADGPESLHEPWLTRYGVAVTVTDDGTVAFDVLATGETDRAALDAQIAAAEPKAPELVNRARAEAGLPAVRLDPALVASTKQHLMESTRRGCFVGSGEPGCPAGALRSVESWYDRRDTWLDGEAAFRWYLAPASYGDDMLTRFGSAATIGPDGTVWAMIEFGR